MASSAPSPEGTGRRRRRRGLRLADLFTLLLAFVLMGAVYLLPPDTSLAEVRRQGTLKVCVPESYPPLLTTDAEMPGFDIELMQAVADRLGVGLALNRNPVIGRDFNPRNWRVNRAQCEVIAGGVVTSSTTRSFLETIDTGLETGWAAIMPEGTTLTPETRVGVYPGLGGLDRLALSGYLRQQGVRATPRPSLEALGAGLAAGEFAIGIAESLGARQLAAGNPDWTAAWLPASLGRFPLGIGLWKGDLTLKRALTRAIDELQREGVVDAIAQRYGIEPITAEIAFAE